MPIRPENLKRSCDFCGMSFIPYRGRKDVRWCSTLCKKRAACASPRQAEKTCPQCGKCFRPEKSAKRIYCTDKCRGLAANAAVRADPVRLAARRERQKAYTRTPNYRVAQRSAKARRRAVVREGSVTVADWKAILGRFCNRCAYCGALGDLTVDHVVALALGGRHEASNVVPACLPCNSAKGTADWSERLVAA